MDRLGPRQVGKTTLILRPIKHLQQNGQSVSNIFYYNLDDIELRGQIRKEFREKIYLFIAEGQKAPKLSKLLPPLLFLKLKISIKVRSFFSLTLG